VFGGGAIIAFYRTILRRWCGEACQAPMKPAGDHRNNGATGQSNTMTNGTDWKTKKYQNNNAGTANGEGTGTMNGTGTGTTTPL